MLCFFTGIADAMESLLDAVSRDAGACFFFSKPTAVATKRVYTIHYKTRPTQEIVDWQTAIISHDDGRTECVATPVYAARAAVDTYYPAYETIETADALDIDALLARDDVRSVTWEDATVDDVTSSESDDDDEGDGMTSAWIVPSSRFGLDVAVASLLQQAA